MNELTAVYRRRGDVVYRVIDDEAIVVRTHDSEVLGVNRMGAQILDLVDGQRTVQSIVDSLGAVCEVDPDELRADVSEFLRELADSGVLERG
jgi:hypothetical protein